MADAFSTLLKTDHRGIRKWGRILIAVEDYSDPLAEVFFDATTKVPKLPATAKQLGFITQDGFTRARAISGSDLYMAQSAEPVRNDLESISDTLSCAFGEASNAWVNAVYNGMTVAAFPEEAHAPWIIGPDLDLQDFPFYRVWAISADGAGDSAIYHIDYMPRAKVTSTTDRTRARTNPESIGFTFTPYKDSVAGGSAVWSMENGPGFPTTP